MTTGATENSMVRPTPGAVAAAPGIRGRNEGSRLKRWYFLFFVVSGACSLVYEVAWLRLAMANFGVTTPMVSIVLSVFMAGLGLGSWGGGILVRQFEERPAAHTLRQYALLELLIGFSGIIVAPLLSWGRLLSEQIQNMAALGSLGVYFVAAVWVTIALLPWCTCMGATIPFMMSAMRKSPGEDRKRSFSFLYLANVLGAVLGTLVPAFVLFELLGFRRTLDLTAALNGILAASILMVSRTPSLSARVAADPTEGRSTPKPLLQPGSRLNLWLLFLTGFVSMALEVIWIRQFTPYLGTVVYAFALVLAFYLLATFQGSRSYRIWNRSRFPQTAVSAWTAVGLCALIPLLTADPRLPLNLTWDFVPGVLRVFLAVMPFSGVVGFLTPMLVDEWCNGDPTRGGKAYGVNVLGCIFGPLLAGFCLLPWLGVRWGTVFLAVPLFLAGLLVTVTPKHFSFATERSGRRWVLWAAALVISVPLITATDGFQILFPHRVVKRDYTATVIAAGTGMNKKLLVNGVGITFLTPITKMMAHLPLAFLSRKPKNGLVICFGMGTTFRAMLSWGIPTTGVELVPSVPALFGYFFRDGPELLKSPLAHVVIDDGRRFLERTTARYDVIVIDPPPPVQAAGSSLLYSREFYSLVKKRLRPGGILQQWLPGGDAATQASVALALQDSFTHLRVFPSLGGWGLHFLASDSPIPVMTASVLAARMPAAAVKDMLQWGPYSTPAEQISAVLSHEISIQKVIAEDPSVPALSDNRPVNEYYLLRQLLPKSWMHGEP